MKNSFREVEEKLERICRESGADRMFVLTDSNVDLLTKDFMNGCPRLIVEAGEGTKSIEGALKVWHFLEDKGAVRRSMLVNLGGGMVSDLGGFAASTFKRGIKCINVPTTLLAAVDAAIGGKTGINFAGLKNEIGTFSMPVAVMPLVSLFSSLSKDEWLSGVGEAIKTGLLDSEELFELATSEAFVIDRDPAVVMEVVDRCALFKQRIVERDFREGNLRKILNLGHTAGHAIESMRMEQGKPVPHGIAVAHGISFALDRSRKLPDADLSLMERYRKVLEKYFPALELTESDIAMMDQLMKHDKKNVSEGRPAWVLLRRIGEPIV